MMMPHRKEMDVEWNLSSLLYTVNNEQLILEAQYITGTNAQHDIMKLSVGNLLFQYTIYYKRIYSINGIKKKLSPHQHTYAECVVVVALLSLTVRSTTTCLCPMPN